MVLLEHNGDLSSPYIGAKNELETKNKRNSDSSDDAETGTTETDEWRTDWTSVYIVTLVSFIGAVHQNCINVWPYLQLMDLSATETFYGLMRSVAGVGGMTSALASGFASNFFQDTRWPMIFGKMMALVSCILYLSIETMTFSRKFAFLIFELFMGISAGAANIYRVHIAHNSTEEDRPKAVGICSLAPGFGLLVGPLLQLAFTFIEYPGLPLIFGTHINLYTAPMLVTILISIIGILLLLFWFNGKMHVETSVCKVFEQLENNDCQLELEKSRKSLELTENVKPTTVVVRDNSDNLSGSDSITTNESAARIAAANTALAAKKFDHAAAALCMFTRAVINLALLTFITIGSPYMMTVFRWTSAETVKYQSILLFLIGFHIIMWNLAYIFFNFQSKVCERKAIVIALAILLICFLTTYPWPFLSETIRYRLVEPTAGNTTSHESLGCAPTMEWCGRTPAVNMFVFLSSIVVTLGICIPLSTINLDILFSKVLGCGIKQGTMQGLFIVCGDGLNVFVPIIISYVYMNYGPIYLWQFMMVVIFLCIVLWLLLYARMISNTKRCEMLRAEKATRNSKSIAPK